MANKFWMIWKDGTQSINKQHQSRESALHEANRLATLHPNNHFYVLEAVMMYCGEVHVVPKTCEEAPNA